MPSDVDPEAQLVTEVSTDLYLEVDGKRLVLRGDAPGRDPARPDAHVHVDSLHALVRTQLDILKRSDTDEPDLDLITGTVLEELFHDWRSPGDRDPWEVIQDYLDGHPPVRNLAATWARRFWPLATALLPNPDPDPEAGETHIVRLAAGSIEPGSADHRIDERVQSGTLTIRSFGCLEDAAADDERRTFAWLKSVPRRRKDDSGFVRDLEQMRADGATGVEFYVDEL